MLHEAEAPARHLSRRKFLTLVAGTAVVATNPKNWLRAAGSVLREVADTGSRIGVPIAALAIAAVDAPAAAPRTHTPDFEIYPGSLEDQAMQQGVTRFIDPFRKGQFALMKAVVINNPDILYVTQKTFALGYNSIKDGKRLLSGELYLNAYNQALERITRDPSRIAEGTNIHLEAIHYAAYAVAAYATPWFTLQEYKDMKLISENVPPTTEVSTLFWKENGIGRLGFPRFYGDKTAQDPLGEESSDHGEDGAMHQTNHTLLAFLYLYLNSLNHPLGTTFPYAVKADINIGRTIGTLRDPGQEALRFSLDLGWAYEVKGTFLPMGSLVKSVKGLLGIERTKEGLVDPDLDSDTRANRLGSRVGVAIYKAGTAGESIRHIARYLDLPRHKNKDSDPDQKPLVTK